MKVKLPRILPVTVGRNPCQAHLVAGHFDVSCFLARLRALRVIRGKCTQLSAAQNRCVKLARMEKSAKDASPPGTPIAISGALRSRMRYKATGAYTEKE